MATAEPPGQETVAGEGVRGPAPISLVLFPFALHLDTSGPGLILHVPSGEIRAQGARPSLGLSFHRTYSRRAK